jgi:hypothetical protein
VRASAITSLVHRELLNKPPPISLVAKRFVKLVGIFSGKSCVQSYSPDSSLSKIPLRSCNQRAPNSAAAHRTYYREGKNSAGEIVMLIAQARECADHSAHIAITHRHKCAVVLIRRDPPHSRPHLRFRCFIAKLAHQLGKRRGIVNLSDANRKIEKSFVRQDSRHAERLANEDVLRLCGD